MHAVIVQEKIAGFKKLSELVEYLVAECGVGLDCLVDVCEQLADRKACPMLEKMASSRDGIAERVERAVAAMYPHDQDDEPDHDISELHALVVERMQEFTGLPVTEKMLVMLGQMLFLSQEERTVLANLIVEAKAKINASNTSVVQ